MNKVLVTGHTGMLGRHIVSTLLDQGKYKLFGVARTSLQDNRIKQYQINLLDDLAVGNVLKEVKPDIIIHTAAITDLNYCEAHITEAYQLHIRLTGTLASFNKCKFYYISTDSVFNGITGGYKEGDPTYPLNYYAQSKLEGEWSALCNNTKSLVIRTNIYGFKPEGGNSLAEWAIASLSKGINIKGFNDVRFNPLYVGQLAEIILKLIEIDSFGLLHVGSSENESKFGFLKALGLEFGYQEDLIASVASPNESAVRRPKNTTLDIGNFTELFEKSYSLKSGLRMLKMDYLKAHENF